MSLRVNWPSCLRWGYGLLVIAVFVIAVTPLLPDTGPEGSDKLNHIAAFLVLTAGAGLIFPKAPLWRSAALLAAYGALIEIVQGLPFVGRDRSLADWLTDCAAIAVAVIPLALSRLRARGRAGTSVG